MKSHNFFTEDQRDRIVRAIEEAEFNTSGEIRVHVEPKCNINVLDRAVYVFNKLRMYDTVKRNGVLIYLAYESRKFAIIGDEGIDRTVPEGFWDGIRHRMAEKFSQGDFVGGITGAISETGMQLKHYFPYTDNDINEQPDEISFG